MADLTDEAKAAIADAVRIVREDSFFTYAKNTLGKLTSSGEPPKNDPPKNDPGGNPPPNNDPGNGDPPKDVKKRKGLFWGDLDDES